jgi:hypothetical protein
MFFSNACELLYEMPWTKISNVYTIMEIVPILPEIL